MIRVDLKLPYEGRGRNRLTAKTASLLEVAQDPAVVGVALVAVGVLLYGIWLDFQSRDRLETLQADIQLAVRDSARFEDDLRTADQLRRRRGEILGRIAAIRGIDENRFGFVYVLDQTASALFTDMWIEEVTTTGEGIQRRVQFSLTGYAPDIGTVDLYVSQLGMSPFIDEIALVESERIVINEQAATRFILAGTSANPDPGFLTTYTIGPDGIRAPSTRPASVAPAVTPAIPEAFLPFTPGAAWPLPGATMPVPGAVGGDEE